MVFQLLLSPGGPLPGGVRSPAVGPGTASGAVSCGSRRARSPLLLSPPLRCPRRTSGLGVLADLNFLHFPEGDAPTGAVFTDDSHFLGAFSRFAAKEFRPQEEQY